MAATESTVFKVRSRRRVPLRELSCLLVGVLAGRHASAQSFVDFRFLNYQESNSRTQVQEPMLLLHHDLGEALGQLDLTVIQDVISGASPTGAYPTMSVTTTTGASGTSSVNASGQVPLAPGKDERKAFALGYSRKFGAHLPTLDISLSKEHDYESHEFGLSDAWTLAEGRGTLHYGLSLSDDTVRPIGSVLHLPKKSTSYALGWTWILGENDLVDFSFSRTHLHGYLDEPYKIVPVGSSTTPDHRPDTRDRDAFLVKYGHYFDWDGALKGSYRFYKDDWGIRAHTLDFTYDQHIDDGWIVSPRVRWYSQRAASFYGATFTQPQTYLSADYRLSPFSSLLYGLSISYEVSDGVTLSVGATTQDQTGKDRLIPLPTASSQGYSADVSPADLSTTTYTLGIRWRF